MGHVTLLAILRRRWPVAVPVLVAAVIAAVIVQARTEPTYAADGTLLLATTDRAPDGYLTRIAQLRAATDALVSADRSGDADLGGEGESIEVSATDAATFRIVARSQTEHGAEELFDTAMAWLRADFDDRQRSDGVEETELSPIGSSLPVARSDEGEHRLTADLWVEDASLGTDSYDSALRTLRLLQITATSDQGSAAIRDRTDDDVGFWISVDLRDETPVANVSVWGGDPDGTLIAFDEVVGLMRESLDERQSRTQIPEENRAELEVIARPVEAERADPVPSTTTWLVLAAGFVAAASLAALVDWRRSPRRREPPGTDPQRALQPVSGRGR